METSTFKKRNDDDDMIFNMSVRTPYPEGDIIDFMALTGLDIMQTQNVINRFFASGITNLRDINTLAKLGMLKL